MGNRMIWVDEELAGKLEIINDVAKVKNEDLEKIIKRLSDDTVTMTECLDENTLRFKLHAQQTRDNYKKVVEEEIEKTNELWEKCEDLRDDTKKKVDLMLPVIKSVSSELGSLNDAITRINTYNIDKLIELVHKFKEMSEEDKDMLAKLLDYKRYRTLE